MTGRYAELVRWAHDGEVFGAAFLRALVDGGAHPRRRPQLEALLELELRTLELLRPVTSPAPGDAALLERASSYAAGVAAKPWDDFLTDLEDGAERALPRFDELAALAPAAERDRFERLAEHERVVGAFARLDRAGDTAAALAVIAEHLA